MSTEESLEKLLQEVDAVQIGKSCDNIQDTSDCLSQVSVLHVTMSLPWPRPSCDKSLAGSWTNLDQVPAIILNPSLIVAIYLPDSNA